MGDVKYSYFRCVPCKTIWGALDSECPKCGSRTVIYETALVGIPDWFVRWYKDKHRSDIPELFSEWYNHEDDTLIVKVPDAFEECDFDF